MALEEYESSYYRENHVPLDAKEIKSPILRRDGYLLVTHSFASYLVSGMRSGMATDDDREASSVREISSRDDPPASAIAGVRKVTDCRGTPQDVSTQQKQDRTKKYTCFVCNVALSKQHEHIAQ